MGVGGREVGGDIAPLRQWVGERGVCRIMKLKRFFFSTHPCLPATWAGTFSHKSTSRHASLSLASSNLTRKPGFQ